MSTERLDAVWVLWCVHSASEAPVPGCGLYEFLSGGGRIKQRVNEHLLIHRAKRHYSVPLDGASCSFLGAVHNKSSHAPPFKGRSFLKQLFLLFRDPCLKSVTTYATRVHCLLLFT